MVKTKSSTDNLLLLIFLVVATGIIFFNVTSKPNKLTKEENQTLINESVQKTIEIPDINETDTSSKTYPKIEHQYMNLQSRSCGWFEIYKPGFKIDKIRLQSTRDIDIWLVDSLKEFDDCIDRDSIKGIKSYSITNNLIESNVSEEVYYVLMKSKKSGESSGITLDVEYSAINKTQEKVWLWHRDQTKLEKEYGWEVEEDVYKFNLSGIPHEIILKKVYGFSCTLSIDGVLTEIGEGDEKSISGLNVGVSGVVTYTSFTEAEYYSCLVYMR